MELAPLRSLNDFMLGSARFQLPNYKDLEKWGNRVAHNLLYYQTNYFLMGLVLILFVGALHPFKMFTGGLAVFAIFGIFYYFTNSSSSLMKFKKDHPFIGIAVVTASALFVVNLISSLVVVLFGILLPISAIFIHSSLRTRNIKNKLSNIERVMGNNSPMGVFLETLGMQPEFLS